MMMIRYSGPLQHDGVSFRCLSSKGRHFDYVVEYNILYWYHIGSEKRVLIFFLVGLYLCVTHTHTHTHTHLQFRIVMVCVLFRHFFFFSLLLLLSLLYHVSMQGV